jgi:hypothetical protein
VRPSQAYLWITSAYGGLLIMAALGPIASATSADDQPPGTRATPGHYAANRPTSTIVPFKRSRYHLMRTQDAVLIDLNADASRLGVCDKLRIVTK